MEHKIKIKKKDIWIYMALIPFLYPRGFNEYFPVYKSTATLWLYVVMIGILIYFFFQFWGGKITIKTSSLYVLFYFGLMLIETLLLLGTIQEGLQKIFATPVLCMLCMICFRTQTRDFIRVMSNLLIFNNVMNCTLFSPPMFQKFLGLSSIGKIIFLGHVQIAAQIGILSIFIAYLIFKMGYVKRGRVLIFSSIGSMVFSGFFSGAAASYICTVLIVSAYILYRFVGEGFLTKIKQTTIFNLMILINVVSIMVVIVKRVDFEARYYVWIDAIGLLREHWLTGYGVYGVLLRPFWINSTSKVGGMNYAHNEILQHLLDGGLLLFIAYIIMVNVLLRDSSKTNDTLTKYWANVCLLLFMAVGVSDSVSEYNFIYIFFLLLAFLPEIMECIRIEETVKLERGEYQIQN